MIIAGFMPTPLPLPSDRLRIGDCVVDVPLREVHAPGARRPRRITPKSMGVLLALPGVAASRVIIAYARQHDDIVPNFKPTSQAHEEIAAPDIAATTEN